MCCVLKCWIKALAISVSSFYIVLCVPFVGAGGFLIFGFPIFLKTTLVTILEMGKETTGMDIVIDTTELVALITKYTTIVGFLLLVMGIAILVLAVLGFVAGCCTFKATLIVYLSVAGVILAAYIIGVATFLSSEEKQIIELQNELKAPINKQFVEFWQPKVSVWTAAYHSFHVYFKCILNFSSFVYSTLITEMMPTFLDKDLIPSGTNHQLDFA